MVRAALLVRAIVVASLVLGARAGDAVVTSGQPAASGSPKSLLAIIRSPQPHRQPVLVRLDPLSLEPVSPQVEVGEYHYAWSFSPDRSQLALATGGPRGSIRIVDLTRMEVVRDVRGGIATEALGWLTPNRLVAALQRGGLIVVDPTDGQIVHRHTLAIDIGAHAGPQAAARAQSGLVVVLTPHDQFAPALLALADAAGGLRTVSLEQIQVGSRQTGSRLRIPERAGFALDATRERVFVAAARGPVAEVDLKTMEVRYRRLSGPSIDSQCSAQGEPPKTACSSIRRMLWLRGNLLALFGRDLLADARMRTRELPAGAAVIDTDRWTGRMIDTKASAARFAAGTLLLYGGERRPSPEGIGLRGYDLEGRQRFHLFGEAFVFDVHLDGYAYALMSRHDSDHVRIVDLVSGKVVRTQTPPWIWVDLISEPE